MKKSKSIMLFLTMFQVKNATIRNVNDGVLFDDGGVNVKLAPTAKELVDKVVDGFRQSINENIAKGVVISYTVADRETKVSGAGTRTRRTKEQIAADEANKNKINPPGKK